MKHEFRIALLRNPALFIALVLIDQFSKYLIRSKGGFYVCNNGIAFGLSVPLIVFAAVAALLLILAASNWGFVISNLRIKQSHNCQLQIADRVQPLACYGAIFMIAGAVSNIIDRVRCGCVIDFIDFKFWPIFNMADMFIVSGAIFILVKIRKL